MVHYPTCILKIGPLLQRRCMRYETKHNFLKKTIKNLQKCHLNIGNETPSQIAYNWQTFDPNRVMISPGKMLSLNLINWGCEIAETLQVPIDTKVLNVRWAKPHMNRPNLVVGHKVQCAVSFSTNLSYCF